MKNFEQGPESEQQKFEEPIRQILKDHLAKLHKGEKTEFDSLDIQFDGDDFELLNSENFDITQFVITHGKNAAPAFHFRAGTLNIHITNKAAAMVQEMAGSN